MERFVDRDLLDRVRRRIAVAGRRIIIGPHRRVPSMRPRLTAGPLPITYRHLRTPPATAHRDSPAPCRSRCRRSDTRACRLRSCPLVGQPRRSDEADAALGERSADLFTEVLCGGRSAGFCGGTSAGSHSHASYNRRRGSVQLPLSRHLAGTFRDHPPPLTDAHLAALAREQLPCVVLSALDRAPRAARRQRRSLPRVR